MLTAKCEATQRIELARIADRGDSPFTCPGCGLEVVLHKGQRVIHHFKHKPPVSCNRGIGESAEHMRAKLAIYDALKVEPNVLELELEKTLDSSVADVFARINGVAVAIEIQRSALSTFEISRRTENYRRLGIAVLWIALHKPELHSSKYSPNEWEKWCHVAYFGRVYYWMSGQTLLAVHFGDHSLEVKHSEWYSQGGEHHSVGGYSKRSKRYRTPKPGQLVEISKSFFAQDKSEFAQKTILIPACRLYLDRQIKWWK